jgi:hypothetical protein
MQQNHPAFLVDIENYPRDPVLRQFAPHFIEAVSHWPANWHPNRPAKLDSLDVFPNPLAIFG